MPESGLAAVRKSLERQSLLVAILAAIIDAAIFASSGIFGTALLPALTMTMMLVAADLALALGPGTAAVVAYIQVVTRICACLLLGHYGLASGIGTSVYWLRATGLEPGCPRGPRRLSSRF